MFVYFMTIWNNLWPFGIICGHLVYFPRFGMFGPRKIWQPCCTLAGNVGRRCVQENFRSVRIQKPVAKSSATRRVCEKKRPKCSPTEFWSMLKHNFYGGK
jgi:hypothetical protein